MVNAKSVLGAAAAALETAAAYLKALAGWRCLLAAFAAGVVSALALAPVYALPLMAAGFSVLIVLIDASGGDAGVAGGAAPRARLRAFAVGWFFGFGYFLAGIYWMAFSFFVQADEFAWMAPFAVLGMPAFLGFFTGAATLGASLFWHPGWPRIFIFAALWAVFEYLRGHILTGLPWNLTGQALAGAAISAQTAAWYGAYGLSLVTVFLAAAPAVGLSGRMRIRHALAGPFVALAGVALIFAIGAARLALPEPAVDGETFVRIVQPNIPQREKIDPDLWGRNFYKLLDLSKAATPPGARLFIVWPENAAPLLDEANNALGVLSDELPKTAVLITGAVRREPDGNGSERYFNSIMTVVETPEGRRAVDYYDKHHLVPFGEYLPFYGLLKAVGLAQLAPYGDAGFAAGGGPSIVDAGGPTFSPLICYEVIFPGAMYPSAERPQWLVTVTNDAWFGDTSGPRQHLDQARLRSIETGLPMVRSANTGISALIDAKGRILARVRLYQSGVIDAALPAAIPRTLYDRTGDWIFWLMTAISLAIGAFWGKSRARS